jgi:hypothetical protein
LRAAVERAGAERNNAEENNGNNTNAKENKPVHQLSPKNKNATADKLNPLEKLAYEDAIRHLKSQLDEQKTRVGENGE